MEQTSNTQNGGKAGPSCSVKLNNFTLGLIISRKKQKLCNEGKKEKSDLRKSISFDIEILYP